METTSKFEIPCRFLISSSSGLVPHLLVPGTVLVFALLRFTILFHHMVRSKIPGPRLAKVTNLIHGYQQIKQTSESYIHSQHLLHGPLVQIAPNQISLTSPLAIHDAFAAYRRLDRSFDFTPFHNYGSENLVSTTNGGLHTERRKCVRALYHRRVVEGERTRKILEKCVGAGAVEGRDGQLCGYIDHCRSRNEDDKGPVNFFWLFRFLGVDFMSAFTYGERFGLNLLQHQNEAGRRQFQRDFDWEAGRLKSYGAAFQVVFPHLATLLKRRGWVFGQTPEDMVMSELGRQAVAIYSARATTRTKTGDKCLDVRTEMETNGVESDSEVSDDGETLCEQLVAEFEREGPSQVMPSREYVLSECLDHFWAGVVTTGDALTAAVFHLSHPRNKGRQDRLRRELREANVSLTTANCLSSLKQIKYLECVIRETLRLNPPIALSLTRKVGPADTITIEGHKIPPGMSVGFQSYSVHRNSEVFVNPEIWTPERWEDPEKYAAMKRHFMPFGAGARMCIGMNVAWTELYAALACLYSRYETTLTDEMLRKYPDANLGGSDKDEERKQLQAIFRRLGD